VHTAALEKKKGTSVEGVMVFTPVKRQKRERWGGRVGQPRRKGETCEYRETAEETNVLR